ncbi:hypothetical protein H6A64_14205 [Lacrimispora saccharolytica]|nr:hypothetical protein [Lacrimispora saccharolytica]
MVKIAICDDEEKSVALHERIVKECLQSVGIGCEIPVAINMFPGNTLDHQTAVPTYEETVSKMGFDRKFIFIADKGVCTGPIMCSLLDDGNGYIISKSLKKSMVLCQDLAQVKMRNLSSS